jgi:predicted ATPase/DNA-binding SARP family transcriptional activator/Tfp pilus assembly protein PilF
VPLLAYLLLHLHEPLKRNWLAFTLWPDIGEADARANLRRFLHDLKQLLPPESEGQPWLLIDTNTVQWNPAGPCWLDVAAFEEPFASPEEMTARLDLYTGDLLEGVYEEWLLAPRERLRNRFFELGLKVLQQHQQTRQGAQAVTLGQRLLALDPVREDVVRALMTARHNAGDRAGALQEYQRFEHRLRDELGVEPMLETKALYDSIARQLPSPADVAARAPVTAVAPASSAVQGSGAAAPVEPPSNLPAQLTSFIGRELEVLSLKRLLTDSVLGARLLTLTGAGGSGKSRLAQEVAARLRRDDPERFPHGIFIVRFSNVRSPAMVPAAVAEVLHVPEVPGQSLTDSLHAFLRPRRLLLLLDNFEHILEAGPWLVEMLQAAPGLHCLVTSRSVLRLYGEHEYQVQPLQAPDPDDLPPLAHLAQLGAVALFVARSRAVNGSFALTNDNAREIAVICQMLDGLPLAIELAAARSKLLAPAALLARLENRLDFLVARDRQAHDRHQTLRAALDWSYQLLAPAEQQLLQELAVFAGGFTLEQADTVCTVADVIGGIENLLDSCWLQHLVDQDPPQENDGARPSRLRMLFTVRDYAREQLALAGRAAAAYARHAQAMLQLAHEGEAGILSERQRESMQRMPAEHENVRMALHWAFHDPVGDRQLGLELAAAMGMYWLYAGFWREGVTWLTTALDDPADAAVIQVGRAHLALGLLLLAQGEFRSAQAPMEMAIKLLEDSADRRSLALAYVNYGRLINRFRAFAQAEEYLQRALDLSQALHFGFGMCASLVILAAIEMTRDNFPKAEAYCIQALALARRHQNRVGMAHILTGFGELARQQDDYGRAETLYREAMTLAQELNQKTRMMMLAHNLGYVALQKGDMRRAAASFKQALQLGQELPDRENFGMCLIGLGGVSVMEGKAERAARLFGAGDAELRTLGVALSPADQMEYDRYRALAQQALGEPDFARHYTAGQALSEEEAEAIANQS